MYPLISEHPALRLFNDLLAAPSPSGREERVAQIIRDKLDAYGYAHQTDGAGNVLVRLAGRQPDAPLCCITAHMDEIGMVVTQIEPDGSLRVDRSGGLYPWKLGEGPVEVIGDGEPITGIFSMGSTHSPSVGKEAIAWKDVRILTGLSPAQLCAAGIRPGSTAVPVREGRGPVVLGDPADPLVGAWTFDDRMGAVALLRLLEALKRPAVSDVERPAVSDVERPAVSDVERPAIRPYHPTLIAFTVHEEGGAHGAKALAQGVRPETFISIDGCPMPPGTPLQLDGRPGIWSKDSVTHYDQRLVQDLCRAAREAGTELQPVVFDGAASDASLVYAAGGAQRVACFGQVRENSHGYEVARLSVFDNLFKTLLQFVTTWEG